MGWYRSGCGRRVVWAAVVACAAGVGSSAAAEAVGAVGTTAPATVPATKPAQTPRELVALLGDGNFRVREAASRALWELGDAAVGALEEAATNDDPEVAERAKEILQDFRAGIHPGTSRDVVELARAYRRATEAEAKRATVQKLLEMGRRGDGVVARLAVSEANAALRDEWFERLSGLGARGASAMAFDGDFENAAKLLDVGVAAGDEGAVRAYAALCAVRGTLDDAIARASAADDGTKSAKLLAQLHRAKGDLAEARRAAARSGDAQFEQDLACEAADWPAVAKLYLAAGHGQDDVEAMGFRAAYLRLSGREKEAGEALAALRTLAAADSGATNWFAAKALFINGQTQEAIGALRRARNFLPTFETLVARQDHARTLLLLDEARMGPGPGRLAMAARAAVVMAALGKPAEGVKLLEEVQHWPEFAGDAGTVIDGYLRMGDRAAAERCAAAAIAAGAGSDQGVRELESLAGQDGRTWARAMKARGLGVIEAAREGWRFASGELPAAEIIRVLEEMRAARPGSGPGPVDAAGRGAVYVEAGEALLERSQTAQGLEWLRRGAEATVPEEGYRRLGHALAKAGRWGEAADAFARAAERDRSPAALMMRGWCVKQAGRAKEGEELMRRASLAAMGSEHERYEVMLACEAIGATELAMQQRRLLSRTGAFGSWAMNEALRRDASDARRAGEHARAAELWTRATLECLKTSTSFSESGAYVSVPASIERELALAAVARGDAAEVGKHVKQSLEIRPADIDLAIELVPAMSRAKMGAEADALFEGVLAQRRKMCEQFPESGQDHNALAWLLARTRRNLDEALTHATRACELLPKNTAVLDTLAEVRFVRGERDAAMETMKKCVELEPANRRHALQLKRISEGKRDSEPPEE